MGRTHFAPWYRLARQDRYLLWYSNEADGVVIDASGHIPVFVDQTSLRDYATTHTLPIKQEEPILHDLDAVTKWLQRKRPTLPECNTFLSAWNLFSDVAASVEGDFDFNKASTREIYNKIFWGSNLPALTPPDQQYTPHWSRRDYRTMREVLRGGLSLFRKHTKLTR